MGRVIFVFGSNLRGRHGAGAALHAARHKGAVEGVGEGLTGSSYALPTKTRAIQSRTQRAILRSVNRFLIVARDNPDDLFQVTAIGCGLAGFKPADIAPMFAAAPDNCQFPVEFAPYLQSKHPFLEMNDFD